MPGLDRILVDGADANLLLNRIRRDVRSDFILAPHLNSVYVHAADEAWSRVSEQLRAGTYQPELPLTISVPKERGFVRPGSVLLPFDRIVYQLLIDLSFETIEAQLDRGRTFSHQRSLDPNQMFEPAHECWAQFQGAVIEMCTPGRHILKADIANYFERIPQHHLINLMNSSGCAGGVTNLLEEILLAFQERDSFGIIQGVFPSDILGNFFLSDFDAYCELQGAPSARYVDDIFIAYESERDARRGLISLSEHLRRNGLHLNEFKSGIHESSAIVREETEIDDLFDRAREEARERLAEFADSTYGFTAEWDLEEEPDNDEIELAATQLLYDARIQYPDQAEKIERFCLPLMRATGSDHAVSDVLRQTSSNPHLTRVYHSYLSRFVPHNQDVVERLSDMIIGDHLMIDYQRMYILGALLNAETVSRDVCNIALQWLQTATVAQEARALAAIFTARHGNPNQKRAVRLAYEGEQSSYVRAAILYASRYFTTAERRTCRRAWGGHNAVNALISQALTAAT